MAVGVCDLVDDIWIISRILRISRVARKLISAASASCTAPARRAGLPEYLCGLLLGLVMLPKEISIPGIYGLLPQ